MLRTIITILCCLLFLLFGFLGEELNNLLIMRGSAQYLPPITLLYHKMFPLNCGYFLETSLTFCAAIFIVRLAALDDGLKHLSDHFIEYCSIIVLLYGLHFGLYLLALVMPYHLLLMGLAPGPDHEYEVFRDPVYDVNILLWLVVFSLLFRIFWKRITAAKKS